MKEYWIEFLFGLLATAATAIFGYLGYWLKKIVESVAQSKEMKAIAKDTVRWIEQVYQDIDGPEKAAAFDEAFAEALTQKGIPFTSLDIARLRESAINELNATEWKTTLFDDEYYSLDPDDAYAPSVYEDYTDYGEDDYVE